MSRYAYPSHGAPPRKEDDGAGRRRFVARRRAEFDPEGASLARAGALTPSGPVARAPASSRTNLWLPLGPQTIVDGDTSGKPRVTGRINALAVYPDGERLYAASRKGGVWYSGNGGASWRSLAGLAATDTTGINRPAHRNACHAIAVSWGVDEVADEVWVGTGEVGRKIDGQPGHSVGGIGILHALGPAAPSGSDPWKREANNLIGRGVYQIVPEPGGTAVIAATPEGLFQRPAGGGENVPWVRPDAAPFDTLSARCSDLLWSAAGGTRPARLWVWVAEGNDAGLWWRDTGVAPPRPFKKVGLAPGTPAASAYPKGRGALAAGTPPAQMWAFANSGKNTPPRLYRVSNDAADPVATHVVVTQNLLTDQGETHIAIAVDPTDANRVLLGGTFFDITTAENVTLANEVAAIFSGHVAANAGALRFGQPVAASSMGLGTHADVRALVFSNGGARLWAATDGGVFRSDRPQDGAGGAPTAAAFYARNDGLQVAESNYVAHNPHAEGFVAAGLQDNASVFRLSSGVWKRIANMGGDGGGVLPRPLNPDHWICQYIRGNWSTSDGTLVDANLLTRAGVVSSNELKESAFYSNAAGLRTTRPAAAPTQQVGQVIFGTTRVWYTEETRQMVGAPAATNLGATWYTLPGPNNPLPGDANAQTKDQQDFFGQPITVCRWQDRNVAWVLGEGKLMRYARVPGSDDGGPPGTWSRETIIEKDSASSRRREDPLRASPVWTDIAVNLDAPAAAGQAPRQHGTKGALYLGNIGKPNDNAVDTLWWYDGSGKWFKTGLRTDSAGVPAPVTAIVCDPAFPEEVYVGTTVGVWRGLRTQVGTADPAWTWSKRVNGLPEATVEDLAIFNDGTGTLRLLRAAIASRGVWELRLDQADVADLTFVRCHGADMRYRATAVALGNDGRTPRSWHGSPDLRIRPAPQALAAPATLPWGRVGIAASGIRLFRKAGLARFQAALRSARNDLRVVPNGGWDAQFSEVLRDLGAPVIIIPAVGATPQRAVPVIDNALWTATMLAPHATREPWGTGVPSEADLIDFHDEAPEGQLGAASMTFARSRAIVDVVVHHRGPLDRSGTDVRVVLLRWSGPAAALPANPATWALGDAAGNLPWTLAVNQVLNSDAGTTAVAFGGGWSFVRTTGQTRLWKSLGTQVLDPLNSGTAQFDVDLLTGVPNNTVVVLVAVQRAGVGASADIALPAAITLQQLALTSPNVAVRSLHLTP